MHELAISLNISLWGELDLQPIQIRMRIWEMAFVIGRCLTFWCFDILTHTIYRDWWWPVVQANHIANAICQIFGQCSSKCVTMWISIAAQTFSKWKLDSGWRCMHLWNTHMVVVRRRSAVAVRTLRAVNYTCFFSAMQCGKPVICMCHTIEPRQGKHVHCFAFSLHILKSG